MSPDRRRDSPEAKVRLPPPLSPAITIRPGSIPSSVGVGDRPVEPGEAVVEPGRVGRHLGDRRGRDGVAEVDHHHGDPVGGHEPGPRPVGAVGARAARHAAAVDVVHTGHGLPGVGPHDMERDGVAVGRRLDLHLVHPQAGGGCHLLGVERSRRAGASSRARPALRGSAPRPVSAPGRSRRWPAPAGINGQDRLDPGVDAGVTLDVVRHGRTPLRWPARRRPRPGDLMVCGGAGPWRCG